MSFSRPKGLPTLLPVGLCALMAFPQGVIAQDHVVSRSEVKKDLQAALTQRREQISKVDDFLGSSEARKAMADARINYQQVRTAVQSLSDEDLARVARQADQAQRDFAAGNLSDRDLLIIILAIAVLVLIIVAVH